jgi:hypothetical protein
MQAIMRPVYNRPEMLYLSLEAEIKARNYYKFPDDFVTIFIIEHGADPMTMQLVSDYPFRNYCVLRPRKFGLSMNILEGMKDAFSFANDYIIYIEDDILLHKTYFQYLDTLLHMDLGKVSVLSAYNFDDAGPVNKVRRHNHYAALAPLITKDFYMKYVLPCSCDDFYNNPARFAVAMNDKYKEHWETRRYRYRDSTHHAQAGIINRLTDVAEIEEDMWAIMPNVNRQQHIGFWGANRQKNKDIPGTDFKERVENLRNIIKDPEVMLDMAGAKQYNDYKTFSSKLKGWDGTLRLV